jgi:hypothetical protein
MQIAMIPVRRRNPDAARDELAAARRESGRMMGVEESLRLAKRNRTRVLGLFRGRLELKAKQVAARAGVSTETARGILLTLSQLGDLIKRREKNTDWFRLAVREVENG